MDLLIEAKAANMFREAFQCFVNKQGWENTRGLSRVGVSWEASAKRNN